MGVPPVKFSEKEAGACDWASVCSAKHAPPLSTTWTGKPERMELPLHTPHRDHACGHLVYQVSGVVEQSTQCDSSH